MASERIAEAAVSDRDGLPELPAIAAPRKLAEDAANLLREQILSGNLRRGTHLVEAKLAGRLSVSRGTIREALKILMADGLVREEPRRGAFVVSLTRTDVFEIYDVRAAVEGRAALLIAEGGSGQALIAISQAIDAIAAAAGASDKRAIRRADLAFHERLCEVSGNGRLLEIFNRYVPIVQTLLVYDELAYPSPEAIADEHRAIFDAIRSGDGQAAAREIAAHCERARDQVIGYFADEPD